MKSAFFLMLLVAGLLVCGGTVNSAEPVPPEIRFDNTPERGVPKEAADQNREDANTPQTVPEILGDSLSTIRVRYFGKAWKSEAEVSAYLAGLVADKKNEAWSRQRWAQGVGVPEIECLLTFRDHTEGRLLLWKTVGCLRDSRGRWWFINPQDYFHRHHPQGDRSLGTRPAPPAER